MAAPRKQPYDFGFSAFSVKRNFFKNKSLSSWAANIAVGCHHGCRFCYVPEVAAIKQESDLSKFGISKPDEQWGKYVILHPWDEEAFRTSVKSAERIPKGALNQDGNRAVIYCSTTDPYQTFPHAADKKRAILQTAARNMVRKSLEILRDESTLNVRILTRNPLAKLDFDIFKSFGKRLVFGMSLPTLNDKWLKIYEPNAPGVKERLKTLQEAKAAGLHVYVAMAPTYPDCDEADLRATLEEIKKLNPITVFHEPINLRAGNVDRIEKHVKKLKVEINTEPLKTREAWRIYSIRQMIQVQEIATELGMQKILKLWPDADLGSQAGYVKAREFDYQQRRAQSTSPMPEGQHAKTERNKKSAEDFAEFKQWLEFWWDRVSCWPH